MIIYQDAIRDTSAHQSGVVEEGNVLHKTFIIENLLDQTVSLLWMASANQDFSNPFVVGGPLEISAGAANYATCSSFFPYTRITATCAIAPTTGTVTIHVFKYTGA